MAFTHPMRPRHRLVALLAGLTILTGSGISAATPASTPSRGAVLETTPAVHAEAKAGTRYRPPRAGFASERLPVTQAEIMNWYPAGASWGNLWTHYDHAQVNSDFLAIRALHANTVRVIIQPSAVGFPSMTSAGQADISDVLATARADGLYVQLTLFDLWGVYSAVSQSEAWVSQLAGLITDMDQITLVELQNEMNPGDDAAMDWARQLLPYLGTALPGVPRTVSVAGSTRASGLQELDAQLHDDLDVIDVHLYDDWGHAVQTLLDAKQIAGSRPVIIGEAGQSTTPGRAASAQSQASFFALLGALADALHLPPPAPWTLNDFTQSGSSIPHQPPAELNFGLRTVDGKAKPSYAVVKAIFAAFAASNLHPTMSFDGSMEAEQQAAYGSTLGYWHVINSDLANAMGSESSVVRSGRRAVYITGSNADPTRTAAIFQTFPVPATRTVTVSAYTQLVDPSPRSQVRIAVAWFDANQQYLGQTESPFASTTVAGWQQLTLTSTAPSGATQMQVHLKSTNDPGTAYFDDVTISGLM